MNKRTDNEIEEFFNDILAVDSINELKINILRNDKDMVRVEVTAMWEAPGLSFDLLRKMSVFLGTEKVGDEDFISETGCETCDYGSKYGYVIRADKDD